MKVLIKALLKKIGLFNFVVKLKKTCVIQLLLFSDGFLKYSIKKNTFQYVNKRRVYGDIEDSSEVKVLTIWETDRKYDWLVLGSDDSIPIFHFQRHPVEVVFKHLLKSYVRNKTRNTIVEFYQPHHKEARSIYFRFCQRVAKIFKDELNILLLVAPKMHDDWIIELLAALKGVGIKIIVNERESVNTPKRLERAPFYFEEYVGFEADLLCVCNQTHWDFWEKAKHPVNKMHLLGDIKSDYWYCKEKWLTQEKTCSELKNDRKKILFFAFGQYSYLNYYYDEMEYDVNWNSLNDDYHETLLEFLRVNKGKVQLIYKTGGKPQRDLFGGFDAFMKKINAEFGPEDFLYLNAHYSTLDLIRHCDIALGFQTTAMIEASFTSIPIIFGAWGKSYDMIKETLLPFETEEALIYADSKEILLDKLNLAVRGELESSSEESRKRFREKFYYCADGKRGNALFEIIKKHYNNLQI